MAQLSGAAQKPKLIVFDLGMDFLVLLHMYSVLVSDQFWSSTSFGHIFLKIFVA